MQEELPLQLLFDSSLVITPGQRDVIRWGVLNTSAKAITDLNIALSCNADLIKADKFKWPRRLIQPGVCDFFIQGLEVHRFGRVPVDVHVSGTLEDASRFDLVSAHGLFFSFPDSGKRTRTTTIDVGQGQDALIKGVGDAEIVNIKVAGSAIIDIPKMMQEALRSSANFDGDAMKIDLEKLVGIPLCHKPNPGLYPLDLTKFAGAWGGLHGVTMHFVDEHQRLRGGAAKVGEVYCLQISSRLGGYLTVLSRGTSGKFYALAPNTVRSGQDFAVTPGTSGFLPGDLLPLPLPMAPSMDILTFGSSGEEMALVLLTRQQLPATPYPPLDELAIEDVTALLRAASAMPGSSFALAKIDVEKNGFQWV